MTDRDGTDFLRRRLTESIATAQRLLDSAVLGQAVAVADAIVASLRRGGKVLFFGNGGSAMDAGHLAAELLGRLRHERSPLPALSLADHTAALTAIGNDYGYPEVFARQVAGLGRAGDVAVGLSTSGDSDNVWRALAEARRLGLTTVALTGRSGGRLAGVAEICLRVPSEDTQRVQEACLHLGHSICELVESRMVGVRPGAAPARPRPAGPLTTAFLDRDGTLNRKATDGGYVTAPDALRLLPGVGPAVRRLNDAGIRVVVVTNQRGVHRGLLDERGLAAIHERLRAQLAAYHARIDRIFACTHGLDRCACRKPRPGLLLSASRELPGLDLSRAVTVGDAETDVAAGIAAGTATIRLAPSTVDSAADVVLPDLSAAVDWILSQD